MSLLLLLGAAGGSAVVSYGERLYVVASLVPNPGNAETLVPGIVNGTFLIPGMVGSESLIPGLQSGIGLTPNLRSIETI